MPARTAPEQRRGHRLPFIPHKWFAEQAARDGWGNNGLDAYGLPRHGSAFWDGVPPARLDGNCGNEGDAIVHRRFVNGPHRFVWLVTMYDEASDTAYGCYSLNYDDGDGRWGPIPMAHVRMLGGRADASWKRPLPYADAILHRARVSAPDSPRLRIPPHALVGFDACPSDNDDGNGSWLRPKVRSSKDIRRTIEIPRRLRPCGMDSETGAPMYEYCYGMVPQDGAAVVLDTIYQSRDAGALALARRLNGSYGYTIRVCRDDGGCSLCRDRPCIQDTAPAGRRAAAVPAPQNGGGRK